MIRQRAPLFTITCKTRFTLAGKLANAVSTPGAIATRIAGTLVKVEFTSCTYITVQQTITILLFLPQRRIHAHTGHIDRAIRKEG